MFRNRQADTAATSHTAGTRFVDTVKPVKEVREMLGRNSNAVIANGNLHYIIDSNSRDHHPTPLCRMLDGICDQVREHLYSAVPIREDARKVSGQVNF